MAIIYCSSTLCIITKIVAVMYNVVAMVTYASHVYYIPSSCQWLKALCAGEMVVRLMPNILLIILIPRPFACSERKLGRGCNNGVHVSSVITSSGDIF